MWAQCETGGGEEDTQHSPNSSHGYWSGPSLHSDQTSERATARLLWKTSARRWDTWGDLPPPLVDPLLSFSLHFTSSVSHLTCSCTSHVISLIKCVCQLRICPFTQRSLTDTHTHIQTHTHCAVVLSRQLWHNPDYFSCLEEGKCVLCRAISLRSPDCSLPGCFDPHGTAVRGGGGPVSTVLCFGAWGPGGPPRCHSLLPVAAARPLRGANTRRSP